MPEENKKQDKPGKKLDVPPKTLDPKLSQKVDFTEKPEKKTRIEFERWLMTDKPSKPQERPKPEKPPVPPIQNDPLLGDYIQKGDKPIKETREK